MPRKSIVELEAQADATLEDNSTGSISPSDVRTMVKDFLNAIRPAYGVLQKTAPSTQVIGLTPVIMQWTAAQDSDPLQTNSSAAIGRITRTERGTSTINFTADLECQNGRFVTFTLFKNGVATTWRVTGNGGGTGNPIAVALAAVDYADPAAYYEIFVSAELAGTNVALSNAGLILSVDPVNSFV